jgi:hypothetical protein
MNRIAIALAATLGLAACGSPSAGGNEAEALMNAAEQSTPEAAAVLENAAEQGANVQEAMQAAGNAQAEAKAPVAAPPAQQAKPHAKGDPVPPPKVKSGGEAQPAEHQGNHTGH